MKKRLFILLALTVCMTLCSCSAGAAGPQETKLQNTEATAGGNTSEEDISGWEIKSYVDEFYRTTDNNYICCSTTGTFSSLSITHNELRAEIMADRRLIGNEKKECVCVMVYEHGEYKETNPYSEDKYYSIKVLEENENVISAEGVMFSKGGDRIVINNNSIINAMKINNTVIFRVDEEDEMKSYVFTVDCTGFSELFDSLEYFNE